MCFILGKVALTGEIDVVKFLSLAETVLFLRGRDAIGACLTFLSGNVMHYKRIIDRSSYREDIKEFLSNIPTEHVRSIMLQTRAIPEAEVATHTSDWSLADIQPFTRKEWTVSHNGTVANFDELKKELDHIDWEAETTVDSVVLPCLFAKIGPRETLKDKVEGSFAIAALSDERTCILAKNFQPLYYSYDSLNKVVSYSSISVESIDEEFPAYSMVEFHRDHGIHWQSLYRKPLSKSVIVVHSSGLDSTVSLRLFQVLGYKVAALHFLYSQQAETAENVCSEKICEILSIPRYVMRYPTEGFKSPLLEKTKQKLDALWDAESTFSYVPQRNLIMSAFALALAEQNGYSSISLGYNLSDSSGYADNSLPFLQQMNELTPYSSNWQTRLHVSAPFVNMMKSELLAVGLKIGVPFKNVCSCYYPKLSGDNYPIYCGDCGCELLYRYAWAKLGYSPPNLGFESLDLPILPASNIDPSLRMNLGDIPYGDVIKWTL